MMDLFSQKSARIALVAVATAITLVAAPAPAGAQGFFQSLFGAFTRPAQRPVAQEPLIYGDETPDSRPGPGSSMTSGGTGGAFCVRSCDGRYFPVPSSAGVSRAELCNQFCPASTTAVVYGSNIDNARTPEGRAYSSLPNAFRFRTEMVAGCTCNGSDGLGLARIDINKDRTLRQGDIVVGQNGPLVATGRPAKSGGLSSTNVPPSVRNSFARSSAGEAR
jgi:hypothetical protein